MKGRKPKPTSRQIAEGDPRKKGINKLYAKLASEPQPTRGLPSCPKHLKGRARSAWKFWVEELEGMKLDRRPDAMMLEGACCNYARAIQAELILERDGPTVEESIIDDKSGERVVLKVKKHPAVEVCNSAWRQMKSFCSEFGLSPVSRTRLTIDKTDQGPGQDLMSILSGPRVTRSEKVQ